MIILYGLRNGTYSQYGNYLFEDNLPRMAGDIITCNRKLYIPAQICIKSYGDAVSIQEIFIENGSFNFKGVKRIYSPSQNYDLGVHTFNVYQNHI